MAESKIKHRRTRSSTLKLKRLLQASGSFCLAYLIAYLLLFASGDADNPEGFIHGDINQALYFVVGLCYLVNVSAAIKSYMLGIKYKQRFQWFWVLAAILTIFFILLVIINYVGQGAVSPNEFMDTQE